MRAGGKSNRGVGARYRGALELYAWLLETYTPARAVLIVALKSMQTLLGLRVGRCPYERWFAH
jgi:hypothetical protein